MRRTWAILCAFFLLAFGCATANEDEFTYGRGGKAGTSGLGGNQGGSSRGGGSGAGGRANTTGAMSSATGATSTGGASGSGAASTGGTSTETTGGNSGTGNANGAGASGDPNGGMDCAPGEKLCSGVCVDIDDPKYGCDPTLCSAAGCPSVAGATLVCRDGQCLVGSCTAGTKECAGRCVAISDPAYGCGATTCDALTCPSVGTGGTLSCDAGTCVVGTCPTNYKKCGNKCVSVSDPTYGCGASSCDATSCPAAGTGTLICQAGACVVGACGASTKKCGDKCVTTDANNGCAEASRCTPCANNEACGGSPSKCQCVPTPMTTACTGKCGSVSDGCGGTYACTTTCSAPQTCAGGGTANVCGCTPTLMATACKNKNCDSVPNGCGGTYSCGTCTSPQTCGGSGSANVCGCTAATMATACTNRSCGSVSNGCGGTISCGTCTSPQACSSTGTCVGMCVPDTKQCAGQQPQLCDANRAWKNSGSACGVCNPCSSTTGTCTVTAGVDCNDSNACTTGEKCQSNGTCGGGTAVTCTGADQCHTVAACAPSTGCPGAVVATGTSCNDSNACTTGEKCQSNGVCGGGSGLPQNTSCMNNKYCDGAGTCKCRVKSSWNLLPNPGFDGITGWTVNSPASYVSNVDVDSCTGSGSVLVSGSLSAAVRSCSPIQPNKDYYVGYRFKASGGATSSGTANCTLIFFSGTGSTCDTTTDGGGNIFGTYNTDSWIQVSAGPYFAPENATKAQVNCTAVASEGYYDQLYLSLSTPGLPAF